MEMPACACHIVHLLKTNFFRKIFIFIFFVFILEALCSSGEEIETRNFNIYNIKEVKEEFHTNSPRASQFMDSWIFWIKNQVDTSVNFMGPDRILQLYFSYFLNDFS